MVKTSTVYEVHVLEEAAPTKSTLEEGELVEIAKEKTTRVASELDLKMKNDLIANLRKNTDIFVRDTHDLTGIDLRIAEHCLNITKGVRPVKQRKRHFREEKDSHCERGGEAADGRAYNGNSIFRVGV